MTFPPELWLALLLTLKLAAVSALILVVLSVLFAFAFRRARGWWANVVETLVTLPIVLPPTVLGFYLLTLCAPSQPLGRLWYSLTGTTLTFSFTGLVVGSVLYSLPYAVQPVLAAFRSVPQTFLDEAVTLGAGRWQVLWHVLLPMSARGVLVGLILGFAHTVGEFGVVLMIGGSIPGRTRVASIALYDEVQKFNLDVAHGYAVILVLCSFVLLFIATVAQNRLARSAA